jgi:hypothetical protein
MDWRTLDRFAVQFEHRRGRSNIKTIFATNGSAVLAIRSTRRFAVECGTDARQQSAQSASIACSLYVIRPNQRFRFESVLQVEIAVRSRTNSLMSTLPMTTSALFSGIQLNVAGHFCCVSPAALSMHFMPASRKMDSEVAHFCLTKRTSDRCFDRTLSRRFNAAASAAVLAQASTAPAFFAVVAAVAAADNAIAAVAICRTAGVG